MTAPIDLSIAFQPMIAVRADQPFAWSACATAANGRSFAATVAALAPEQRPALEMARISAAIRSAVVRGIRDSDALLAIPVGAGTGMSEHLLGHLFREALAHNFPLDRVVVEINADERGDFTCAAALAQACARRGVSIALEGFGGGSLALKLLARFTPLFVKLDAALVRNIDASVSRRLMAEGVMRLARSLGVSVIARGAESRGEHAVLSAMGVRHFQLDGFALPARQPRREPRTPVAQHRRWEHHQRTAVRAPAAASAPLALAL